MHVRERTALNQRVGRCQCVRSLWHTQTKTLAERSKAAALPLSCVCLSLLSLFHCGCGLRALISCGCCAANLQENLSSFTVGFVGQVVKNERRAEERSVAAAPRSATAKKWQQQEAKSDKRIINNLI